LSGAATAISMPSLAHTRVEAEQVAGAAHPGQHRDVGLAHEQPPPGLQRELLSVVASPPRVGSRIARIAAPVANIASTSR
jgi:hypothetical protein